MDNPKFSFSFVSQNETASNISVKTITEIKDVLSFYVFHNFNNVLSCFTGI